MNMRFQIGDQIQGTIPILALKTSEFPFSNAFASIETSTEDVPFEGIVTKVLSNGEVKEFKLTKPIGELNVGTSIKVNQELGICSIQPLP